MRKILILFSLLLCGIPVWGQKGTYKEFFAGLRAGNNMGMEVGMQFNERFAVKAISACDWNHPFFFKDSKHNLAGKTHRVMYGAGASLRVGGPFWVGLDAGYGWSGKYAYADDGSPGMVECVKGLDLGVELRWDFSEYLYALAGYETIPAGFKLGCPVHEVFLGIGFHALL